MKPVQPIKLEDLLERLGSSETPIDVSHRHALRRALLNSPYFESHRSSKKWGQIFSYASTALVGGMAVTVVVVSLQIVFAFSPTNLKIENDSVKTPLAESPIISKVHINHEVEAVSNPLRYLNTSEIPRVVTANVMNFVSNDLNFATTR